MNQGFTEIFIRHKILFSVVTVCTNLFFKIIRLSIRPVELNSGNVIVIALHKLGDSVFTIPAIRKIENHFSNRAIKIICYTNTQSVYKITFPEENIIAMPNQSFRFNGRIASSNNRRILKQLKPEYIFDLTEGITSVSLIFNSRAREIIGFNRVLFKSIYTHYSPKKEIPHISNMYLWVLHSYFQTSDTKLNEEFPIKINSLDRILIHPLAGWKAKEWNLNKYISLVRNLSKTFKVDFVIPGDMINSREFEIIREEGFTVIKTDTTEDLISELKKAQLLISNDSGPIYVAGLLGIPTFTIFGPTNPIFHNIGGKYHQFIQKKINCSPLPEKKLCFTEGGKVGCPSFECMHLLSVNEAEKKVENFISDLNSNDT
jgi:heptosyltransferase-2